MARLFLKARPPLSRVKASSKEAVETHSIELLGLILYNPGYAPVAQRIRARRF